MLAVVPPMAGRLAPLLTFASLFIQTRESYKQQMSQRPLQKLPFVIASDCKERGDLPIP